MIADIFDEVADIFNRIMRSAIQFKNIHRGEGLNAFADVAFVARLGCGAFYTVKGFGEYSRHRGFTNASRPAEKVSMADLSGQDGFLKGVGDMTLADNLAEKLGTPFTCCNNI